jgi:hypothetical protein
MRLQPFNASVRSLIAGYVERKPPQVLSDVRAIQLNASPEVSSE